MILAPQVGFEPTAYRLTVECSTTELLGNIKFLFSRTMVLYNTLKINATLFCKFFKNIFYLEFCFNYKQKTRFYPCFCYSAFKFFNILFISGPEILNDLFENPTFGLMLSKA